MDDYTWDEDDGYVDENLVEYPCSSVFEHYDAAQISAWKRAYKIAAERLKWAEEKQREPTWLATLHKVSPPSGPEPRPAPLEGLPAWDWPLDRLRDTGDDTLYNELAEEWEHKRHN